MQLRLDAADRLVELVEERRGPVVADEAARRLFALRQAPVALARSLLAEVVESDARLAWNGDAVGLARPRGACRRHGRARPPPAGRPRPPRQPRAALLLLRHLGAAVPSRAARRTGDRRGAPRADRARAGARRADRRRARRARGDEDAARVGQARARARRAAAPGRVPLLRPERAAAVRRPGTRPACAIALLLPLGPAAACGGGGARRGSSDRMARARLRARGRAGGAAPDPRAASARERAHCPTRPLRLATQAWR